MSLLAIVKLRFKLKRNPTVVFLVFASIILQTFVNMSENPTDLAANHVKLQENNAILRKELERLNQELYDCRRQIKTAEALEKEYQEEIRILQSEQNAENKKLEAKIQQLEESNILKKASFDERICLFEKELSDKQDEIENLKRELEAIKVSQKQPAVDESNLVEEVEELKQTNLALMQRIEELEDSCDNYSTQNQELEDKVVHFGLEIDNLKEILDCKKEQIEEQTALIQTMKDEYACLKTELDSIQSKPLDDKTRGNSLFAEVDDRRLLVQDKMRLMRSQYLKMKQEHSSLLQQISLLRVENASLTAKVQAEIEDKCLDQEMVIASYKNQIAVLNELIESYKRDFELKEIPSTSIFKPIEEMLKFKDKEIETLRQEHRSRSINQTVLSHDLASERRENRKLNLEILKLQNEIGQLKVQIEQLKIKSPTEKEVPAEVEPVTKSILKSKENSVNVDEVEKENEHERRVQFTEGVNESKTSSAISKRRGAKILISKPVFITTNNSNST